MMPMPHIDPQEVDLQEAEVCVLHESEDCERELRELIRTLPQEVEDLW
jgi:hypothetical protein